jgi:GTP-binding protein HflX
MIDTSPEPDRAILVGVNEVDLGELKSLCETCNIFTVGELNQNVKVPDPATYIGSGKVLELKELAANRNATVIVFDIELSGSKVRNLENATGVTVLDRSKVILDIFAQRAESAEGKLQVELAQLKYNLPRLIGSGGVMSKMKNSVGMRGPGEKKLELDRRKIHEEISALEKKLEKVKQTRDLSRKSASQSGTPSVCLVGYTNSGKSTLLNTLAKSHEYAADKLFATLDPKTARVRLSGAQEEYDKGHNILLTDTVGFIDRLPHEFIKAFESTLDSVRYADLLLHVVDASNPDREKQIATVNEVLKNIGADKIDMITVYNKIDRPHGVLPADVIAISARGGENIDCLKQKIVHILWNESNNLRGGKQ